jgi:peroxiredoxin Q/BCP
VAYFAASTDDPETNRKFAESLKLDYPILSDPSRTTAAAFGVLQGTYAARHTFYIGADGRILFVDDKVSPKTAGEDAAARLQLLGIPKRKTGKS